MRKLLLLPLAIMMAACSSPEIQVMSFNIRLGVANDGENSWPNRCPATIAMLQDQKPDIFGLQEAFDFQIGYINENLPVYDNVGVGRDDGVREGETMAIFWNTEKIELLDWGTYWLSETPEVPSRGWDAACIRTATWTKLRIKDCGKEFFYVNTHLDHVGPMAQKNGLALIVERIAEMNPNGIPMILTGDFNVTADNPCLEDLNRMMKSARVEAPHTDNSITYNAWGNEENSSVIDYIYYSGFKSCDNFKVVNQSYAGIPYVSDHYPVTVTLKF